MFKKIVVGCAEDQAGKDAVLLAARLAALLDSEWTVVFPYQPLLSLVPADVLEESARSQVRALVGGIADLREPVYHWSASSWPIHALHEMALYENAELIVFGAARGRLAHLHMGLMERIVHGAPCAIAIAPERYAETAPHGVPPRGRRLRRFAGGSGRAAGGLVAGRAQRRRAVRDRGRRA